MRDDKAGLDTASFKELLRAVRLVAFDFDGVFTDNMVYVLEGGIASFLSSRSNEQMYNNASEKTKITYMPAIMPA